MTQVIAHLKAIYDVFTDENNYGLDGKDDFNRFKENAQKLHKDILDLNLAEQLYSKSDRQMILADLFEYVIFGRGYYSLKDKIDKENFTKFILHFVNILMSFEAITVNSKLRKAVMSELKKVIPEIKSEDLFQRLFNYKKKIGLKKSRDSSDLDKYFDTMLPKTAGGLWHELLVYIFLLRNDVGFIIPLLLTQRLISRNSHIVPPDFLVIAPDKRIYGIEVGRKKEIQSGTFSLQTSIPTATVDTENSRTSDRCPICKQWLQFCDLVINNYSNYGITIKENEVRCLSDCTVYKQDEIAAGKCPYSKYARGQAKTLDYTNHEFASGLHYHYQCVLRELERTKGKPFVNLVVNAKDKVAIKTHYPYYSGLDEMLR